MGWIKDSARKPRVLEPMETTRTNNPADWILGIRLNMFKDQIRGGIITFPDGRQPIEIWLKAIGGLGRDLFVTLVCCASTYTGVLGSKCLVNTILGDPGAQFNPKFDVENWVASGFLARKIKVYADEKTTVYAEGILGTLYPDVVFIIENTPLTVNSAPINATPTTGTSIAGTPTTK